MKHKFDTNVQLLKYQVLKGVAKLAYEDKLETAYDVIPHSIVPGPKASMRCCIYKERAIVQERIKMAMGGNKENPNVIEVLNIACDECPVDRYKVQDSCRGCIAHRCKDGCPVNAITIINQRAVIDYDKCIECGKCAKSCPYNAINEAVRPCERSCKVDAIKMNKDKNAEINNEKCISCGACVYQCPFGAIVDKSYILDAIKMLREAKQDGKTKVYAVVAPSIYSQFSYAKLGQVISAIKLLGFHDVIEAALGADMVADKEAKELEEKGFLTSSCCPAFVSYIEKSFPDMLDKVSHNRSPMAEIAHFIKKVEPLSKVVFIGPCTAKKMEIKRDIAKDVDIVLTFEELQALIDSRDIELETLEEDALNNASYFGRIFARSGGVSTAVKQALKEQGSDFEVEEEACDGITACKIALLKASKGVLKKNFIEGMACEGGCIGGAACLTHGPKDKAEVDKYGELAKEKGIKDAITVLENFSK